MMGSMILEPYHEERDLWPKDVERRTDGNG